MDISIGSGNSCVQCVASFGRVLSTIRSIRATSSFVRTGTSRARRVVQAGEAVLPEAPSPVPDQRDTHAAPIGDGGVLEATARIMHETIGHDTLVTRTRVHRCGAGHPARRTANETRDGSQRVSHRPDCGRAPRDRRLALRRADANDAHVRGLAMRAEPNDSWRAFSSPCCGVVTCGLL